MLVAVRNKHPRQSCTILFRLCPSPAIFSFRPHVNPATLASVPSGFPGVQWDFRDLTPPPVQVSVANSATIIRCAITAVKFTTKFDLRVTLTFE